MIVVFPDYTRYCYHVFPYISLCKICDPQVGPILGVILNELGRGILGDTYQIGLGLLASDEKIFKFSLFKPV